MVSDEKTKKSLPHKENVVFNAICSTFLCAVGLTLVSQLKDNSNKKLFRDTDPRFVVPALLASCAFVGWGVAKDKQYNKTVDGFAQRIENDRAQALQNHER